MLRLRGHTPCLLLGLPLHGLQVQHGCRAAYIEEVLAHPFVACPPTLAGSQVRQAMLHFHPLAHLRPARPRRCPLPQAVLEGLVFRNAHRAAAPQRRCRALRPRGTPIALCGWELHRRPQAKGLRLAPGTGNGFVPQIGEGIPARPALFGCVGARGNRYLYGLGFSGGRAPPSCPVVRGRFSSLSDEVSGGKEPPVPASVVCLFVV
jgi:hypothetical protein